MFALFEKLYNVCRTPGRATVIGSKLHSPVPFLPAAPRRDLSSSPGSPSPPPPTSPLSLFHPLYSRLPTRLCYPATLETFRFVNKPGIVLRHGFIVSTFYIDRILAILFRYHSPLHPRWPDTMDCACLSQLPADGSRRSKFLCFVRSLSFRFPIVDRVLGAGRRGSDAESAPAIGASRTHRSRLVTGRNKISDPGKLLGGVRCNLRARWQARNRRIASSEIAEL